jgi:glycosyltransferase involved in cell wall biosynthesis
MKILCFIDSLNSGGAQRQFSLLAVLLKEKGIDVEVMIYCDFDFFKPMLNEANIPITMISSRNKLSRILSVRKALYNAKPDIVIAFLDTPSLLVELAMIPKRKFKLIVSERSYDRLKSIATQKKLLFHKLADAIVTNSYSQERFIKSAMPSLSSRTRTIINCVDLDYFNHSEEFFSLQNNVVNILVIGNYRPEKNPLALIEAIDLIYGRYKLGGVEVDWYGNNWFKDGHPTKDSHIFLLAQQKILQKKLEAIFRLHGLASDVRTLYHQATAVCLPSIYEGCSNVICEAMACGKPILASKVSDNLILVKDGSNGFLFNPESPDDIAQTIIKFMNLSSTKKQEMGIFSRKQAEHLLSKKDFIDKYLQLINTLR